MRGAPRCGPARIHEAEERDHSFLFMEDMKSDDRGMTQNTWRSRLPRAWRMAVVCEALRKTLQSLVVDPLEIKAQPP